MKNISLKMNWMSIVMLLSLGLNFFVIGFIYAGHKAKEIRMTRLSFDNSISKLVEPFPRSAKHDFYVTMRGKRDELIPIYRDIMKQREEIMNLIAAEQLDTDNLLAAMQKYHDIYHNMIDPSQETMINVITELSFEERQAILERFKNPPRRENRSRGDNDDRRRRSGSNANDDDNDQPRRPSAVNNKFDW